MRVSKKALKFQLDLWQQHLPKVVPHYAVKYNNDPVMMRWMTEIFPDMGFDCASEREINDVLPVCDPSKIVYAQPCKKQTDIKIAQAKGVSLTVADSVEELEKLAEADWKGEILVRMLVPDGGSKQPFSKKFGAPLQWVPKMYEVAKAHNLKMTGFSFHVGSECENASQYPRAVEECKKAQEIAKKYGYKFQTMDIGGGFLPDKEKFTIVAREIKYARKSILSDPNINWIAEPGRFLAGPTHTLYTTIIGKKPVWPEPFYDSEPKWRITIDESVYGCFSNIPFDHQKPVMELLPGGKPETRYIRKTRPTIVFGRTCDSGDCIGTDILLYEPQVGDKLRVQNMGAYTTVTASEFNGFPKAEKIYEME